MTTIERTVTTPAPAEQVSAHLVAGSTGPTVTPLFEGLGDRTAAQLEGAPGRL